MLECLIIGDSIAVGVDMFAPRECVSYARSGITSQQWNRRWRNIRLEADTIVISLGTNDYRAADTQNQLTNIRTRVRMGSRVVWVLPPCNPRFCKPEINSVVRNIAVRFGDQIISTSHLQPDRIHPTPRGYRDLVSRANL